MKTALKTYGWVWVAVIVTSLLAIVVATFHDSHHELAKDPNNIEKIVKVDLPDIIYSESDDDSDSGASRWDMYIHKAQFSEELSEESIRTMDELCLNDRLHWSKNEDQGYYLYSDKGGIDELYYISCIIYKDHFQLTYEVDESEGIFALIPFTIAYSILLKWGVVLIIIALISRIKTRRKNQI